MTRAGVNVIPEVSVREVVALAVEAEQLGYESCWVYDEGLAARDVYVTLAAVAVATERLRLGPGITNPYTRHPGQTAMAIASLDELSGGRAFLGIGAGGSLTLDPLGLDAPRPLTAVRETIEACRRLFAAETVDFDGDHVQLAAAKLGVAGLGVPVLLAGRGPKMLELGGALADGVMLDFVYKPALPDIVGRVRAGGQARIIYSTMLVTDDAALEAVKPHMTYRLVDSPPAVQAALGLSADDIRQIREAMAGGLDAAGAFVRDDWVLPFVVTSADELDALMVAHGMEEFLLPVLDPARGLEQMRAAARVLGLSG